MTFKYWTKGWHRAVFEFSGLTLPCCWRHHWCWLQIASKSSLTHRSRLEGNLFNILIHKAAIWPPITCHDCKQDLNFSVIPQNSLKDFIQSNCSQVDDFPYLEEEASLDKDMGDGKAMHLGSFKSKAKEPTSTFMKRRIKKLLSDVCLSE